MRGVVAFAMGAALLAGCSTDGGTPPAPAAGTSTPSATSAPAPTSSPTDSPSAAEPRDTPTASPRRVRPGDARVATAMRAVRQLAGVIGPRPGTSPAYFRAADWVEQQLVGLGWAVERQRFATPAGNSWGIDVPAGDSVNLVAHQVDPPRPGQPWLLVGAHLDTVPQAPGAEDNASGIGVLLTAAEAMAGRGTRLPVVLVAFGSEEPRGPTDADHHFGSRAYVDALPPDAQATLAGMVALDRVGVGTVVPIGSDAADEPVAADLERAAGRAGVPTVSESGERSSDHWSFTRAGLPAARLGSTPYAAYHSAGDLPAVVDPAQVERVARLLLSWLR